MITQIYKTPTDTDIVATFQIDQRSVRGRAAKLADLTIDSVLKRHNYPRWAAKLLGEALVLAVLSAATLKIDGRVLVQAEGDGPIKMLVAEARTDGGIRGYVRLNEHHPAYAHLAENEDAETNVQGLLGQGVLGLIIIQDDSDMQPYQGIVPLDGQTIADCAQHYFNQSEQIPTRVKLSVDTLQEAEGTFRWRAGGAIIQQIAADDARGDTQEDWDNARALFDTLTDEELASEALGLEGVLYRLFHETGVRLETPLQITDSCTCSKERLTRTLKSMPPQEIVDMAEDDGVLEADCQFCGRIYRIPLSEVVPQT
jgi:molecular chaperone Hsp33